MKDIQGKWWIIDKPEDYHYGTLNFDDDNIILNISGHFPDETTKRGIRYVKLLHGKADDGTQITLLNCILSSGSYSSGRYSKSVYKADIVFYHHFFPKKTFYLMIRQILTTNNTIIRSDFEEVSKFRITWVYLNLNRARTSASNCENN